MATFCAIRGLFTPNTSQDNVAMTAGFTSNSFIRRIGWSGRRTTSSVYRTRWARPSTDGVTPSSTVIANATPPSTNAASASAFSGWATQPTLPAEPSNLFAVDWNAAGGGGELHLPWPGWMIAFQTGYRYISCRNVVGTDANGSSYLFEWEE